ncbi:MAG: hypothetical protein GX446_07910 [Chthonomonadales bacterium]|nr:hypothetical protein [Chthonomonadales bacterium]
MLRVDRASARIPRDVVSRLQSGSVPLLDQVELEGGGAVIARDRSGRWNFAALIRPGAAAPSRPWIGTLRVMGMRARYVDEAMPRNADRRDATVTVSGLIREGRVLLDDPTSVAWSGDVLLAGASEGSVITAGRYDSGRRSVILSVSSPMLHYPEWCDRFLPRGYAVHRASVGGRFALAWSPSARDPLDWQGEVDVSEASVTTPWLRGSALVRNGSVAFGDAYVQGRCEVVVGGTSAVLTGGLSDFARPRYSVRLSTPNARLETVLREVVPAQSYRSALDGLRASGPMQVRLDGSGTRAVVTAETRLQVSGTMAGGAVAISPARASISVAGPWNDLQVRADTRGSRLAVHGVDLRNLRLVGRVAKGRLHVAGMGGLADGRWSLRGSVGVQEPYGYQGSLSIRGANLATIMGQADRLVEATRRSSDNRAGLDRVRASGSISADLQLYGSQREPVARGSGIVQVLAPKLDNIDLDEIVAVGRFGAGTLTMDALRVCRGGATARARGDVHIPDWTGSIEAEASDWPIPVMLDWAGAHPTVPVGGTVSLQDVRLDGDLRRPHLRGTAFARGLQVDNRDVDYAVMALEGTPDAITMDGEAIRVPSVLTLNGMVRRPFTGAPWISLMAHARDVDLADVSDVSGLRQPLSGLAEADALLHSPVTEIGSGQFSLVADRVWAGEITVDSVRASGSIRRSDSALAMRVDQATARVGGGTLTGSAFVEGSGAFEADIRADAVPFDAVSSLTSGYADLTGSADFRAHLYGHRDGENRLQASGDLALATHQLTVNEEDFGDLTARLALNGGVLTGERSASPHPALRWGDEGSYVSLEKLEYDLDTQRFSALVQAEGVPVAALRRAVERSPAVVSGGQQQAVARALAALTPLEGRMAFRGPVNGTPDAWQADIAFDGSGMSAGAFRADRFVGSVVATNERVSLSSAELQTGDAAVTAEGEWVFGDRVRASLSAQGIDLATLEQWLPAESPLRGITGQVDTVSADITGSPDFPEIALFLAARDVGIGSASGKDGQASALMAPAVRLSGVSVREGLLGFDDLAVVIRRGAVPGADDGPRPLELHASGRIPFAWSDPFIQPDAVGELTVRLPETDLRSLLSLFPSSALDTAGAAGGELRVRASRADLERLASGEAQGPLPVDMEGELWLKADRLRVLQMRTALADIGVRVRVAENKLSIGPTAEGEPAARIVTFGPHSEVPAETGAVIVSGTLPITESRGGSDRITLTIPRLAFDEAPFPGFSTGRFAGEITGAPSGMGHQSYESAGAVITVSGTVMQPHVAGEAALRNASIRLPVTEDTVRAKRPVPAINPTFDLRLVVQDGAKVRSNQLSATLGTPAGQPIALTGSLAEPRLNGTLAISSGTLTFPTARFTINRGGTVAMRYPAPSSLGSDEPSLDVSVDLTAQARLSAESVTGRLRRYLVTVEARGPLMEPPPTTAGPGEGRLKLTYRADPPDLALSNEGLSRRITALLGGQDALDAVFGNQRGAGGVLMGKVVDYLGGALMPDLVDQTGVGRALGLSEFSVDYSRAGAFVLRLSRDLPGPFEIGYWKHISGERMALSDVGDWELRLGARLQKRVRLTWTVNDQRTNVYRLEGVYSF